MAQTRDLYEVLEVSRDASQEDIKKSFRRLARRYHPDVNGGDPAAEQRFKEINLAYETLSDPAKRRRYDAYGGEGFTPDMFSFMGDIGDIFEAFFGQGFARTRTRRPARGADLRMPVALSFEEAAFGVAKEVDVERLARCDACEGSGAAPGTAPSRCPVCGGAGQVQDVRQSVFGTVMTARPCDRCGGSGEVVASPCATCNGDGRVRRTDRVTIEVPGGVEDGMELRIEGRGADGPRGAPPGDLYLALAVEPHPVFERRGADLAATLEVPVTQAMLGADVTIETLDGTERIRIEPGTRTGTTFRIAGAGVPRLGRRGRGDLFLQVELEVPDKLPKDQRILVEELAERRGERAGKKDPAPGRLRPLR